MTAGFDTVDVGSLSEGWRLERGQPCYCVRLTADELRHALAQATPITA
jgi:8-hydroxy-5-deazaflavin:NADPH oxidoreductase